MDYISTKELAQKWQLDPSRILRLAKEGRIPGAKLIGNSWMFPADSKRLPDNRRKENKQAAHKPFRFPLYFYTHCAQDTLDRFSTDERTLYEAERSYLNGEYAASREMLIDLANHSDDSTVKIGAFYILCMSNLYLRRFTKATACFRNIQDLLQEDIPHRQALVLLLHDLESYFVGNRFYLEDLALTIEPSSMPQMRDYYMLQVAFADIMKAYFKGIAANPLPYELYLEAVKETIAPYASALLHLYIALLHHYDDNRNEQAIVYLRQACRIAEANGIESAIAFAFHYIPDTFEAALKDTYPAQLARLRLLSAEATEIFNGLHESLKKNNILQQLRANDSIFVRFAKQGMTNKQISALLGLSVNTISKKYSAIFEKTGTHSRKELAQLYTEAIEDY